MVDDRSVAAWEHCADPSMLPISENLTSTSFVQSPDYAVGQFVGDTIDGFVNWDELAAWWGSSMTDIDKDWNMFLPRMDLS